MKRWGRIFQMAISRSELIADLVQAVGGTIVECNTAYGGARQHRIS